MVSGFVRPRLAYWVGTCAACILAAAPVGRATDVAKTELHAIQTSTLTDREFLTGSSRGRPVVIGGQLRIPTRGTERLSAVLILGGHPKPAINRHLKTGN
jgi:hypothetical protein